MPNLAVRTAHYRAKGEGVRTIADSMNHAETKRFLMTVATDYEMLAQMLEQSLLYDPIPASE